jgi:hypothetical protein
MTTWAGLAGAGVALVISVKMRKIFAAFEEKGAVRPETARELLELGLEESRILRRLQRKGVIIATQDQRYYLSQQGLDGMKSARRTRAPMLTAIAGLTVLLVLWLRSS